MSKLKEHYDSLASEYDEYWLYSDGYLDAFTQKIASALKLKKGDRFVDLGCGTGIYSKRLRDLISFKNDVICVDPSSKMLKKLEDEKKIVPICDDAISFLEQGLEADKFLMKEVIHHIEDKERLFKAISNNLKSGAIFLILLLPPKIEYPLFEAALKRYEELQPDYRDLISIAENKGLCIEDDIKAIPLEIEKERYIKMVKGRYMSLLSTFTDEEIEKGIKEINLRYDERVLRFNDSFVFLRITKP